MRYRTIRVSFRFVLPAVLSLAVFAGGTPQTGSPLAQKTPRLDYLLRYAIPGTRDLPLIIELTDPSVVQVMAQPAARGAALPAIAGQGRPRPRLDSAQAVSYRAQLARTQGLMMDRLRALNGVQVQGSTNTVVNAIFARVPVEQYFAVRGLPGVKKVYFSRRYRMNLDAAATVQNAQGLWNLSTVGGRTNAGQGAKIGIIDTGIDYTNSMFSDSTPPTPSSYPSGFPKYDTAADKAYTNHKVIVARNYVTTANGYSFQSVNNASDEVGHGTFVAGCAAGKVYNAPLAQISGMAPAASLGNYKIFGTPGINDSAFSSGIVAAIEDAVTDGMDVLNLSLGALDYVPASEDIEVEFINNAIAAGLVVVMAAGNEGPDTHTIDSPGSTPDAIAVGAVWNARAFAPELHVNGSGIPAGLQNIAYQNGSGPAISTAITSIAIVDVSTLDGTGLACSSFPSGSLSGKIALIERGTCPFSTKVTNASSAGARAVIVYNNTLGAQPFTMGGLTSITTPAVMVSNPDGLALKSFVAANPAATLTIDVSSTVVAAPTTPDILLDFSSRGPSPDFGIKPDIMAVGVNVYSSTVPAACGTVLSCDTSSHFGVGDGTSFSTPMVSGAAAALIQLFPNFTPAEIKSALVNTATQNVTIDGTTPATVVQAGNGLLNMGNAAVTGAVFSPTNLNFGVQFYSNSISLTQTFAITNISSSTDQFSLSVQPLISGPAISLSTSNTGPVAPGSNVKVSVSIQAIAPQTGGFQGFITVQSAQTSATYAIPYWAAIYVPDSSRVLTVSQSATGSNIFSNLKDAFAAANPGNIIEIADSQTYSVPSSSSTTGAITVSTNAQGLPLHGITIRAAAGQTPIIDGTGTTAFADLQIVGLQGVLIQGLTINGGDVGIVILQPSTSIPASVTIDNCSLTNQAAGSYSAGIYVENGGDVDLTFSTVSGSSYSGVFVMGGANFTMSNSTIQNSGGDGLDVLDSNVDVISSTISGNAGTGAFLLVCSGTLTKSTFADNTGSYGDGTEIWDGTVTVTGNTFENNDSAGIYTTNYYSSSLGPTVRIERNFIQSNVTYGIQSDQAQSLQIVGNMIRDNGLGLVARGTTTALLLNNVIVRSNASSLLDVAQRNGVYADRSSSVTLVNNTIYKSQAYGIVLVPGATLSVWNTIVSQNSGGDLSGLSASSTNFSFIGGDPKFTNPNSGTDDFSLASGSPAIDTGSNAAPNLPFLDYNQQFRVASAGTLPGSGTVDIGALEAGSSYPLNYPLLVSGANATFGNTFRTGFAALNPSSTLTTQATFTAFDPTGTAFSDQGSTNVRSLGAEAQIPVLDYQLFNFSQIATKVGAVLASSLQKLVGFFLIFDPTFTHLADGVDVSADTYTDFFFVRHESDSSGQATYQVFNPGVNSASMTARLMSSSGAQLNSLTQTVPPKGQYTFAFNSVAASNGYVHVTSDRPVTGLEIFGNTTEVAALRAATAGTETRLFFPHFAVNQGYTSLIGVVNPSSTTANLTLTAFANDGSVLGTPAQRVINANGQLLESASSLFGLASGDMITGYVVVDSDQVGITGFSAFRYANGSVQSISAVPSESVPQQTLLFSHIAHEWPSGTPGDNYLTGIALLNPFGTPITYTMTVFDGSGSQVAQVTNVLGAHAKVAKLLSWPTAGAGFFTAGESDPRFQLSGGHIEVTTDYQLLGFEMFFTQSVSQLAAVMAQFPN